MTGDIRRDGLPNPLAKIYGLPVGYIGQENHFSARWLSLTKSVGDRRFASVRVSPSVPRCGVATTKFATTSSLSLLGRVHGGAV